MTTKTRAEVVQAAQKIIFGQEGNYGSVNANDNGAVSIGKVQWHAGRALALLKKICAAENRAASILGAALYAEITTAVAGAWNARKVNAVEKAAISKLLSTDAGKRVQDAQAEADVGAYVKHGLKVGVEDPAALVYFADLENQGGGGASARVAAAAKKPVTLDTIHAAGLADRVMGKYSKRRKDVYNAAQKLAWSGTVQASNGGTKMAERITTGKQLAEAALNVAKNYKTLYVMGCFGAPLTAANKKRYTKNNPYNTAADRVKMINAASADTFGFDCVCLIKGLLWGWRGDASKSYGGADYAVNGVPDIGADTMITKCSGISTDFSKLEVGEAVWCKGHIGIYIGGGLAVECTPKWKNCVQVTACNCSKSGYNRRNWTKHGKLPYVSYTGQSENITGGGTVAPTQTATSGDAVYVVTKGDTLSKIAAKFGTTYQKLAEWNGIKNPSVISAGQVIFTTEAAAAIGKLAKLGVINSPDYWQKVVASGKVKYLDILVTKAAGKITKAGARSSTVENAVGSLVAAGVINTPDYWLENRNACPSLGTLLCALGGAVK